MLLRGVKNLVNRFGVTVGGFLGFNELERSDEAASLRDLSGDEGRMSWSTSTVVGHSCWLSWEEVKGSSAMAGEWTMEENVKETTFAGCVWNGVAPSGWVVAWEK